MIYAFFSFGGIEVMGLLAIRLRNPKEAPKAGRMMIGVLTLLYLASLTLALSLDPWEAIKPKESPFVSSLQDYKIAFVPHFFNGVFIIAGFSTMVASLFAVITIFVKLAKDGNAPRLFARTSSNKRQTPYYAIGLTSLVMMGSIVLALLMPDKVYEYVTTAAALMLLFNWIFIIVTSRKLIKLKVWGNCKRWIGIALILTAISGTLFHETSRPGLFISFGFLALITLVTWIMVRIWKTSK